MEDSASGVPKTSHETDNLRNAACNSKRPMSKMFGLLLLTSMVGCGSQKPAPLENPHPPSENQPALEQINPKQKFTEDLWQTPLGVALNSYLLAPMSDPEFALSLDQLSKRLLSDKAHSLTRISVVQLLTEDLYRNDRLTEDAEKRLRLLESRVSLRRLQESQSPLEHMAAHIPVIIVASLPFGSPLFRQTLSNLGKSASLRVQRRIVGDFNGRLDPEVNVRNLFTSEILRGYEIRPAFSTFLNVFGVDSFLYFSWHELTKVPRGDLIEDKMVIYDYDTLLAEAATY